MAMRQTPTTGGSRTPTTGGSRRPPRPPVAVQPVYEDFKPTIKWQEDDQSNTLLLIYLPGFQRENLKVSTEGRYILRARGETIVAGNKWRRFQEDYPLTEDCNVIGIRAKFEAGILTIIIPKIKESTIGPTKSATTSPSHQKPQENQQPPPQQQQQKPAAAPQQDNGSNDINGPNGIPSAKKARAIAGITEETPAVLPTEKEDPKKGSTEKLQESDDYKKETIEKIMEKLNDQKLTAKADHDGTDKHPMAVQKIKAIQKSEIGTDYDQNKTDAQEIKKSHDQKKSTYFQEIKKPQDQKKTDTQEIKKFHDQETKEKQKYLLDKKGEGETMEPKERKTTTIPTGAPSTSRDTYKQAIKKFLELKEERQLLVNVGAAVLVIIAFGAYLFYNINS